MYIDARINKKTDQIDVVERVNGKRVFNSYPRDYSFYVDNPNGQYKTIFNTPVQKITPKNQEEYRRELVAFKNKKIWESDINPIFKCLSQNYLGKPNPVLHVAKYDIETDYDSEKGYSAVDDPFNKITAISIHLNWTNQLITLAIPPKTLTFEQGEEITNKFEDTFLFRTETEMINTFLDLIEDADVLCGWNSEGFDLPYIVNRMNKIMTKDDTRRLSLWGEFPKVKKYTKFGKECETYTLTGRVHLDLMDVYRKFTYEERHSYSLNAIAEYELEDSKTPYDGSLDTLYNDDFEKFIDYSRQDVRLLHRLDEKLQFLELLNEIVHGNTVLLPTGMGMVAGTDQAIINRAHELGFIVPNKKLKYENISDDDDEPESVIGAYVATPKSGIHEYVGIIDVNGLYPSSLRALNMGIETIFGQIRPVMSEQFLAEKMKIKNMTPSHAWENQFGSIEYQAVMNKTPGIELIIDWENDNSTDTLTAEECYNLIFNSDQKWMLSANGTIFRYDIEAIIPGLLTHWAIERKAYQKKKAEAKNKDEEQLYESKQIAKKLSGNGLYGALLNIGSRFHDKRIGQSITLCGRVICQHMNAFVNECITGKYDYRGDAVIYADTDSIQFSAYEILKNELEWNKETAVQLYSEIGDLVNGSFSDLMKRSFNCPEQFGKIIKAGFESLGTRGLYITKKRYAILNYWKDGKYLDKPKLKAMGLDLRRSDTPVVCQKFLEKILIDVLNGISDEETIKKINEFKLHFKSLPLTDQGTPKRVNKLTYYEQLIKVGKGNRVPGHVRAALNWNSLRRMHGDKLTMQITDGMKCIVCQLNNNALGMTSVAYPIDETRLPEWYSSLPFDGRDMGLAVVDKKIENLLCKLDTWDYIREKTCKYTTFSDFFA